MTESRVHRLSRFILDTRTTYSTDLRTFIEFAVAKDPGARFDLGINLSAQQRSELGSDVEERLRPFADVRISQTFHSAHTRRDYVTNRPTCTICIPKMTSGSPATTKPRKTRSQPSILSGLNCVTG